MAHAPLQGAEGRGRRPFFPLRAGRGITMEGQSGALRRGMDMRSVDMKTALESSRSFHNGVHTTSVQNLSLTYYTHNLLTVSKGLFCV